MFYNLTHKEVIMKYLFVLVLFISVSVAQTKYEYGNIDMHGGKKESLVEKKNQKFDNKNVGMSNFLNSKNRELKKDKKVKKNK